MVEGLFADGGSAILSVVLIILEVRALDKKIYLSEQSVNDWGKHRFIVIRSAKEVPEQQKGMLQRMDNAPDFFAGSKTAGL